MTTASVMNWRRMSPRRAPRALRVPISRVRSVMLTSMMFITPIPPTSRLMAAMALMASLTVFSMLVISSTRLSMLVAVTVQLSLRV